MLLGVLASFNPAGGVAADIPAPDTFVVTSAHPLRHTVSGGPEVESDVYLNFTRSSADPGTWTYNFCQTYEHVDPNTGLDHLCINNTAVTDIPNRPGWVSIRTSTAALESTFGLVWAFNVSANVTTENGLFTPKVYVNLLGEDEHNQTGNRTLAAPFIQSARVEAVSNATNEGRASFTWAHSLDDPNSTTTGDFRYYVVEQFVSPGQPEPCNREVDWLLGRFLPCRTGSPINVVLTNVTPSGSGSDGFRTVNITWAGTAGFSLTFDVTAVDNATGLWGTQSCETTLDPNVLFQEVRCGVFLNAGIVPTLPTQNDPLFPGVNVTKFAERTGLTLTKASYALGGILTLGLMAVGFYFTGPVGGGIIGILGIAMAYQLNLLPAWVIIVLVALGTILVVFSFLRKSA